MKFLSRIVLTGYFIFAATICATTLARMNLAQLSTSAEIVVRGKCTGTEVRAERGAIWTFATFQIIETMKASPLSPQQIVVRLPGGQLGHIRESVECVSQFFAGEEVVLFLERTSAGDYGITGWVQGTFRVSRAAADSEASVTQDSAAFSVFDARAKTFTSGGIRKMPMSIFRSQIAAALATRNEREQR